LTETTGTDGTHSTVSMEIGSYGGGCIRISALMVFLESRIVGLTREKGIARSRVWTEAEGVGVFINYLVSIKRKASVSKIAKYNLKDKLHLTPPNIS